MAATLIERPRLYVQLTTPDPSSTLNLSPTSITSPPGTYSSCGHRSRRPSQRRSSRHVSQPLGECWPPSHDYQWPQLPIAADSATSRISAAATGLLSDRHPAKPSSSAHPGRGFARFDWAPAAQTLRAGHKPRTRTAHRRGAAARQSSGNTRLARRGRAQR
jgi:hypothetical protein